MATITQSSRDSLWRHFWSMARYQMAHLDRAAWRRFFLALFGLGLAFFLALYSTALREAGHTDGAMASASLSLIIAAVVAIQVVPYLAKRTALERWMIKVEYKFTREGVVYFLIIMVIAVAGLNTDRKSVV